MNTTFKSTIQLHSSRLCYKALESVPSRLKLHLREDVQHEQCSEAQRQVQVLCGPNDDKSDDIVAYLSPIQRTAKNQGKSFVVFNTKHKSNDITAYFPPT